MDDMRRIGAEFGLSPNARLRLSGITPPARPSWQSRSRHASASWRDYQCSRWVLKGGDRT